MELRAERLEWVPGVLALIDRPFVIERPDELRGLVAALAERLAASASASASAQIHDRLIVCSYPSESGG